MAKLFMLAMAESVTQEWAEHVSALLKEAHGPDTRVVVVDGCNQITVTDYEPGG